MQMFRASFYKDLPNSEGHVFRCLQRQFDFSVESITDALRFAEDKLATSNIEVDAVELVPILQPLSSSRQPFRAINRECDATAA